jgi:hypothetical protein
MRFSLIRLSPGQSTGRIPRRHSGWPPVPATHEAPRRVDSVLTVAVAHPARGPSLRRVVLSTPILATTPSSDFRSTLHHFAGHAYRFCCYRSTRRRHPPGLDAGVETDLSCSTMGCVIVPLPLRRRVSGAAHPSSSHRPWPSPLSAGLGTRLSPAIAGWVTTRLQDSLRTDRPLARRPRRLCHGASTVGSLLPPATSYGAAWPLPRPDSHRQVHRSFQDTPEGHHLPRGSPLLLSLAPQLQY